MKKCSLFILFLLMSAAANAETVYLKSGSTATGKIVDKRESSIVLDIGGATVTYYNDEIDRIDEGGAPAAAVAESPVSAPAGSISTMKRDLILKFIDVFGTHSSMKANFEQMMASIGVEEADKLRSAFDVDEIIELLVPLYDRYMSESDLRAYIAFYGSADGRKLVEAIPQIMRGSVEISAKYFEERMPEEFKKGAAAK